MGITAAGTVKRTLLAIAVSAGLLGGCGTESTPAEYLALAQQAYEKRQTELAVSNLKLALSLDPENAEARALLARVYVDEGNGSAAAIELDKAEKLGALSSNLGILRLKSLMLQDKLAEAIEFANSYRSNITDEAEIGLTLAIRGIAQHGLGQRAEAQNSFDDALKLAPNSGTALVGVAQLALDENDVETARKMAEKATLVEPGYAPAWSLLGDILQFKQQLAGAEEAYGEAINKRTMNADDLLGRAIVRLARENQAGAAQDVATLRKRGFALPYAAYAQGLLHLTAGEPGKAAEQFQQVVAKFPNYIRAVCYSGLSHAMLGGSNRAANELERCLKKYPSADSIRRAYAAVVMDLGQQATAEAVLQPLVQREQPDSAAVVLLADIKMAQSDTAAAVELLKKAVTVDSASAKDFLNLGRALTASGEADEAADAFEQAAALDPEIKRTDLIAALSLLRSNRAAEAVAALEEPLRSRPDDVQTLNLMALALLQTNANERAGELLVKAVALKPDYTVAALNLALLRAKLGENASALSLLDEILTREPANLRALNIATSIDSSSGEVDRGRRRIEAAKAESGVTGDLLLLEARYEKSAGKLDDAIGHYRSILEQEGELSLPMRELAETLLLTGNADEALSWLKKLVKRSDREPRDWLLLARAHDQLNDSRSARAAIDEALSMAPNFPAARLGDIRLLVREGKAVAARKKMEELKAAAPTQDIAELHEVDGLVMMAEKRPADAVRMYEEALALEPTSARVLDLARCKAATGDRDGTFATLTGWLERHPDDSSVAFVLADTYSKTGQHDQALETYEKLLAKEPRNALVLNNMAQLLVASNPDRALSLANEAAALLPDSPGVLDTLGTVQFANGQTDQAIASLRKAYRLMPTSAAITLNLGSALIRVGSPEEARRLLRAIDAQSLPAGLKRQYDQLALELGL